MRTVVAVLSLVALSMAAVCRPASAAESIVGRWGETQEVCSSATVIVLAPMRLQSDETICNFTDVTRSGNVVTWRGTCRAGEEPIRRETVVATLNRNHTLSLLFEGTGAKIPNLIRCR